jgi:hypothetical protein
MKRNLWLPVLALMGLLFALAVPACSMTETRELPEPHSGVVTDLAAFEEFIALAPTPEEFRAVYPDVVLILPGTSPLASSVPTTVASSRISTRRSASSAVPSSSRISPYLLRDAHCRTTGRPLAGRRPWPSARLHLISARNEYC